MKTIKLLAIAVVAMIGCGDNKTVPDARIPDSSPPDAYCSNCPAAPTLGMQIDRMGRAAVNTALNHAFDNTTAAQPAKVAYNEMSAKTDWLSAANVSEFMRNLAMVDALDSGVCGNGICEHLEDDTNCPRSAGGDCDSGQTGGALVNGCGNQVMYTPDSQGMPTATSYQPLGLLLAEDELYLDTSKMTCTFYLGVEFGVVTGGGNSTCGGRAPSYDVVDFSFSVLAMGLAGFDVPNGFVPRVQDGATKHSDASDTDFPFLGAPH
jgi:hypothetical protein